MPLSKISNNFKEDLISLIDKYNNSFEHAEIALFKEGDYIMKKDRREFNEIFKVVKVLPPTKFKLRQTYSIKEIDIFINEDPKYTYHLKKVLSNYKLSEKEHSHLDEYEVGKYDDLYIFIGDKLTKGTDIADNWEKITEEELSILNLSYQVRTFLNAIDSKRMKSMLDKYSSQYLISKKSLEENTDLLNIHKNIEKIRKFKTHIETA